MTQWLSYVLDWYGITNYISLLIMVMCMFSWRKPLPGVLMWALGTTAAYATCNGTIQFLNSNYGSGTWPQIVFYGLYLLWIILFVSLFAHQCLRVKRRQWGVTLLFLLSDILLANSMIPTMFGLESRDRNVLTDVVTIVFILLLAMLYRQVMVLDDGCLSNKYWCMVSLAPVLIIVLTTLWAGERQGKYFWGGCVVLVTLDITVYLLFMWVQKEMQIQVNLHLDNQALSFQMRQMDNVKNILENTRTARHELKSNYFLIESYVREGKTEEALRFLHEVIEPSFEREETVSTGNHFVDMVLSQKVAECRQYSISTALNVLLPQQLAVNQQMLCSLLFNLWDNAIEASVKTEDPDIRFSMHEVKGYLAIEIRNRIDHSVLQANPKLRTSKTDRANHGIGMAMVRQIVERCEGDLQIFEENEYFVVSILLAEVPA